MVDAKMPLLQLAADRRAQVYVVQSGDISRYEGQTGKPLGKLPKLSGGGFTSDVALALDGGMVAIQRGEDIVRLDGNGQAVSSLKAAISEQSGDSELSTRVAIDGLGNIYAAGRFNNAVFKFGPNGKYITRFGGKGNQPGQFSALFSIAVDGQGRVYVGDSNGIQVFDENGRYLDTLKLEQSIPFGLVFNDKNELFVAARTRVYKLSINKN
jgi:outer membrane protein assembly factor BamB